MLPSLLHILTRRTLERQPRAAATISKHRAGRGSDRLALGKAPARPRIDRVAETGDQGHPVRCDGGRRVESKLLLIDRDHLRLPDGRQLGYAESGVAGGLPLVFVPGYGRSRLARGEAAASAAIGARIITIDLPGVGASDPRRGYTLLDWTADLRSLVDGLGIERFAIAGWSWGAPYALAARDASPRMRHRRRGHLGPGRLARRTRCAQRRSSRVPDVCLVVPASASRRPGLRGVPGARVPSRSGGDRAQGGGDDRR